MLNVRNAMRRAAMSHQDRLAIECGDRQLTFGDAWARGLRMANALLDLGLRPGDRVGILESNCLESSDILLGLTAANLVRVALYKRNSVESHVHMLENCGCRVLIVDSDLVDEVGDIQSRVPCVEHVIVRDENYEHWLMSHRAEDPAVSINHEDIYIIRHSGGTTGRAKGIAFSHSAWLNMQRDWMLLLPPIEAGDAAVHGAPISHGSGYLILPIWLSGGYNLLMPKFDASEMLRLMQERGGYSFAVPTMVSDYNNAEINADADFSAFKALLISGAPISAKTITSARQIFGDRLFQLYGQTEATPVAWMSSRDWFAKIEGSQPLISAGRVVPFTQVDIRDEENNSMPPGEAGEIALQNDGQMSLIWNDPEATKTRLVDGWVLTGDIGYMDQNGFLYLSDRKDDMIISGGLNIWPKELENAIDGLPAVREVAVFGIPDPRWGEVPLAIVVPKDGHMITEDDVISACVTELGSYKKPARVIIRQDPLPRSPVGKVQRKTLREPFWEGQDRRVAGS